MGFRFQRRFPLSKLIRLNASKSGVSLSPGPQGTDTNIRGGRITGNLGIPGTGLSYRKQLGATSSKETDQPELVSPAKEELLEYF